MAVNTLGVYNPIFYAQEALIHLWNALGMASRVHLGFSAERERFRKGDTINIRKPSTFVTNNAPSISQDLDTETVPIVVDQWKEVKFTLTDKELALTQQQIIDDHIAPAAYSLANNLDQTLADLYLDVPWFYDTAAAPGSTEVGDITGPRRVLFDNAVPIHDQQFMHYMIDGALEEGLLRLAAFSQQQGAGTEGITTQRMGTLGMKYGVEVFANQNVKTFTTGTLADPDGALVGAHVKGATSISIDGITASQTPAVIKGDTLLIDDGAGSTQRYAVTASANSDAGGLATILIFPALTQAYADNDVVNIRKDSHVANLMFHRNAFALVVVPLPDIGNELGARVATITDPVSRVSLRSRVYYMPDISEVRVALDMLYGVKTLDPNLAVRAAG